jgi:hypothetical protein
VVPRHPALKTCPSVWRSFSSAPIRVVSPTEVVSAFGSRRASVAAACTACRHRR